MIQEEDGGTYRFISIIKTDTPNRDGEIISKDAFKGSFKNSNVKHNDEIVGYVDKSWIDDENLYCTISFDGDYENPIISHISIQPNIRISVKNDNNRK